MAGLAGTTHLGGRGIAIALALSRGLTRAGGGGRQDIGNFWVDLCGTLYLLLPISFVYALFLVSQASCRTSRRIARSPSKASTVSPWARSLRRSDQDARHNGGGFFNANSAHPFENPTPLTTSSDGIIFAIPAG